jgi:hypothetical protein
VTNAAVDQVKIITLLAAIPASQGGQRENWVVPPLSGPDGSCPQLLADAIWNFQTLWHNLGVLLVVDGVVDPDKSTLNRLNDLADANAVAQAVDAIVKFQGTLGVPADLTPAAVFPDALLAFYLTKPNRTLARIGQTTVTIRDESAQLIADYVARIKQLTAEGRGEVFIYGSSSGGRNAVDLAVGLTREGIRVRYVAALDAAWFPDESLTQPDNFVGEPTVLPLFRVSEPVTATVAESYFQIVGNHSELTFHGLAFTSQMAGKEVHGAIEGFTSQDLTGAVRDRHPAGDDDAHIKLTQVATPLVQAGIATVLNSL